MNNLQLTAVLTSDIFAQRVFCGVFPRDILPRRVQTRRPCAYVINTDRYGKPGEHWVCVFFDGFGKSEYFDSFGLPPLHSDIEQFIKRNSQSSRYNQRFLQDLTSSACGLYVIYYVLIKSRGGSLNRMLTCFNSLRQRSNDRRVTRLVRPYMQNCALRGRRAKVYK